MRQIIWVCALCGHRRSVPESSVGDVVHCGKCHRKTMISEEDPNERPSGNDSGSALGKIDIAMPISCSIAQILLILELVSGIGLMMLGYSHKDDWMWIFGLASVLTVPFTWILTVIAIESHRSRLMLRELLEKDE